MKLCSKFITIIYIYIWYRHIWHTYIYIYICIYILFIMHSYKKKTIKPSTKKTWSWRVRLTLGNRSRCMVTHGTHMGPMGKWWNEAINWWYFMGINGNSYCYVLLFVWDIYLNLSESISRTKIARLGIFYGILMGHSWEFMGYFLGKLMDISYHIMGISMEYIYIYPTICESIGLNLGVCLNVWCPKTWWFIMFHHHFHQLNCYLGVLYPHCFRHDRRI